MTPDSGSPRPWLPGLITVVVAGCWGIYWVPVRRLADLGLPGPWGSLMLVMAAAALLSPLALARGPRLRRAGPAVWLSYGLGGTAFVLYSVALLYGRVGIVILLFYLTPVWSTIIGRLGLGWPTPWTRYAAIALGLLGLALVMGIDAGLPQPRNLGEWLGLASGIVWSLATTGMRTRPSRLDAGESAVVFVAGAALTAAVLAVWLGLSTPAPQVTAWAAAALWVLATAGLWWVISVAAIVWAAARLEPARMGILQTSEVLVGVLSAAAFAGEQMGRLEWVGGSLIIAAAILEIGPVRAATVARTNPSA